jgi:hypothetical protein
MCPRMLRDYENPSPHVLAVEPDCSIPTAIRKSPAARAAIRLRRGSPGLLGPNHAERRPVAASHVLRARLNKAVVVPVQTCTARLERD